MASKNERWISMVDNRGPDYWDKIISVAKSNYTDYFYIIHDKDPGKEPHLHLVCYDKAGTTLKAHCARFSDVIAENLIERKKSDSPRGMIRYLVHEDQPDKFHYDIKEVVTNNINKLNSMFDNNSVNVSSEFSDFLLLKQKKMSPSEFIEKYGNQISNLNFYQRISSYDKIWRII